MSFIFNSKTLRLIGVTQFFIIALFLHVWGYLSLGYTFERENAVVQAVKKVGPAVVNVSSAYEVKSNPFAGIDPFFDSFFRDFFDKGIERSQKRTSLGSGVIIDGVKGLILTNAHVIERSGTITVILKDEREFEAQIVGADPDTDLSVLRIFSKKPLPDVEMGNSKDIMIGETVIAIGNPFGFSHTVTTGVVSAVNRSIRTENTVYHDFIQTDASINPGNSGGPLLNINGELIGINTAIYAKAQGIGFAIPINKAKRIVNDLVRYGSVVESWIGVRVQAIDPGLARYLNLRDMLGVIVKKIEAKSPAENAGIKEGDIILSIGESHVQSVEDYHAAMRKYAAGDVIHIVILRDKNKTTIPVTAAIFPSHLAQEFAFELLGVKVENLPSKNDEGVIISQVRHSSYLSTIGVRAGDIIRQIDEIPTRTVEDFEKAIIRYRNRASVVILLQRGMQGYYITVRF